MHHVHTDGDIVLREKGHAYLVSPRDTDLANFISSVKFNASSGSPADVVRMAQLGATDDVRTVIHSKEKLKQLNRSDFCSFFGLAFVPVADTETSWRLPKNYLLYSCLYIPLPSDERILDIVNSYEGFKLLGYLRRVGNLYVPVNIVYVCEYCVSYFKSMQYRLITKYMSFTLERSCYKNSKFLLYFTLLLQSTYKQIGSCLNNMLTQSTIGDSGVGNSSGSVHESPTNQAQFNLIYPNQMLGIQALGIQALGIRAVYLPKGGIACRFRIDPCLESRSLVGGN